MACCFPVLFVNDVAPNIDVITLRTKDSNGYLLA